MLAVAALLGLAALLVGPNARAGAHHSGVNVTLVSNTGQTLTHVSAANDLAQAFSTGSHHTGYSLKELQISLQATPSSSLSFDVKVYSNNASNRPGDFMATLKAPASITSGVNTFTSGFGIWLAPDTTYWVVIDVSDAGDADQFAVAASDAEDSGAAPGWTIDNNGYSHSRTQSIGSAWTQSSSSLAIAVRGYAWPLPTLVSTVNQAAGQSHNKRYAQQFTTGPSKDGYTLFGAQVVYTGNPANAVVEIAKPAANGLPGEVIGTLANPTSEGWTRTFTNSSGIQLKPSTKYFLVFTGEVGGFTLTTWSDAEDDGAAAGWSVAHGRYHESGGSWGASGLTSRLAIQGIETPDTTPPAFASAEVSNTTLRVTFNEELDPGSGTAGSAFEVRVTRNGTTRTIAGTDTVSTRTWVVTSGGRSIPVQTAVAEVTLASGIFRGEAVTVRYTKPAQNPLQDHAGHDVETFTSHQPVTNNTPLPTATGAGVAIERVPTAPPGQQTIFVSNKLAITFDQGLDATSRPDASAFTVTSTIFGRTGSHTVTGRPTITAGVVRRAVPEQGPIGPGSTVTLPLNRSIQPPACITVEYIKPTQNPLKDPAGNEVESFTWYEGSRCGVPFLPATFQSAEVDGNTLTMTFSDDLNSYSNTDPSAFTVTVGSSRRHVASGGVAIAGSKVALTLTSPVVPSDGVKVRYTRPTANPLKDANGTDIETFESHRATNRTAGTLWTATLSSDSKASGCRSGMPATPECSSALSVRAFDVGHTAYKVQVLDTEFRSDGLILGLDRAIPAGWTLHVGDRSFAVSSASPYGRSATYGGSATHVVWDDVPRTFLGYNQKVSVRLTRSAPTAWSATLTTGPSGESGNGCRKGSSTLCSTALTDDDFTVGGTDYQVEIVATGIIPGGGGQGFLDLGLDKEIPTNWTLYVDSRDGLAVSTATRSNGNKTARWTNPGWGFGNNQTVSLSLKASAGASSDAGGGSGVIAPPKAVLPSTSVTGVSVVSDPGADQTYGLGDTIQVRVTFNQLVVDVDTSAGTPRLKIDMDPAEWGEKWASYASGSGTASLTFTHTVVEPNISTQGIAVLENTLELNGGTIRSDGADAGLSHTGLSHDANHKVDWQQSDSDSDEGGDSGGDEPQQSAPASVTGVAVSSSPQANATYALGETIRVTLTFSEAVTVTGSPRLKIDMDPADWGEKWAGYTSGSGTATLTFTHTVVEPNISTQGIAVLANTLALNGGDIESKATDTDADLSHDGLAHDANHKVDWQQSDSESDEGGDSGSDEPQQSAPASVTGVAVSSSPQANATYALGETIRVTLTFSEAVTVTGSPRLKIDMDPADWGEKWAGYVSGSGTTSLTFAHTVVQPNYSTQGIAVLANSLALNGGTIRSDGVDADLSHNGRNHDANHKVDWQ